jgi:hypothetical protein
VEFISTYTKKLAEQGVAADKQTNAAWSAFARVLLTGNAFLYVD